MRSHGRVLVAVGGAAALAFAAFACGSGASDAKPPADGASPGPLANGHGATTASLDCGGHGCGVKQIALGTIAACALLEDSTVACYGGGIVGTLGRGERPAVDPIPQRVPLLKNVAGIFGGGYTMCALLTDKTVTCWGADQSANPYGARPGDLFAVEGFSGVVELAVATSHTCARVESGEVYCFGSNYFGELGDGTLNNTKKPVKVASISGAKHIATGAELSCAVLGNGGVSCWGLNDQGQLGLGSDKETHPMPVTIAGLDGPAKSVAASSISGAVCALLESGSTKCWGEKLAGAAATSGAVLAVGWNHACVLDKSGAVSCWGASTKGQLGNGPLRGPINLATGGDSSCAVYGDGAFTCWGEDSRGQLGGGQAGSGRPGLPEARHF